MTGPKSCTTPAIGFVDVSKTFPGQKALDAITFEVGRPQIHALLGHNGSGKSTLIKILAGVYTADSGSRIEIDGVHLPLGSPRASGRRGLRFVHQELGLIDELSAAENMALAWGYPLKRACNIDWASHTANVRAALAGLGVDIDVTRPVAQVRAVDRTAVVIARALAEPNTAISVLVLDEPTAALPPAEVEALFEILRDVRRQGVTVLHVSHRVGEILSLADEATVLRDGEVQGSVRLKDMGRNALVQLILGEMEGAEPNGEQDASATLSRAVSLQSRGPGDGSRAFAAELSSALLQNVHIELRSREVVGVMGLAGSGREELCETIVGTVPGESRVRGALNGKWYRRMTPARARRLGIALVLPNRSPRAAVPQFSMKENLSLPSLTRLTRGGVIRHQKEADFARKWIERLDIRPHRPDQPYTFFSGGNRQKAVFAKWLAIEPRVLLLDDPTTGVDVGARSRIYSLIREQADAGLPILVASSDVEDLVALCDRVLVLSNGRIIEELVGGEISEARLLESLNRTSSELAEISEKGGVL